MLLLKDMLSSKKFVVFLATVILSIADKAGLRLDPDLMKEILAMAAAYIVGQGIADHGKEAAKISAASTTPVKTTTVETSNLSDLEKTTTTTIEPKV